MVEKPIAVCAAIYRDRQPTHQDPSRVEILMVRRPQTSRHLPGNWTPILGRVESGETPHEAAVRESKEEVGLDVRPVGKVWECDSEPDRMYHIHWWLCASSGSQEVVPSPGEVADYRWMTRLEIQESDVDFETPYYVHQFFSFLDVVVSKLIF